VSGRGDNCPDDLLARSHGGALSLVERRALDAHLGVCGDCRATVALRNLYEQIPDAPSSDDRAVVARLAGRVSLGGRHRRQMARPVAFAAAAALMAAAGAATAWVVLQRAPATAKTSEAARPGVSTPSPTQATTAAPAVEPPVTIVPPDFEAPAANKRAVQGRHARTATADAPDPLVGNRAVLGESSHIAHSAQSAGQLFAAANSARGAGDLRAAARQYELLEQRYPAAPEAAVSLVSAGDLLMRLGETSAALEHFDRYLATNGHDPLALEALFGRARSLHDLGRQREELQAWRELLGRFPGSLYEATARHRVDELAR
jgi:TolA-binding protein